jgi:hypothetical protein
VTFHRVVERERVMASGAVDHASQNARSRLVERIALGSSLLRGERRGLVKPVNGRSDAWRAAARPPRL